jgi:hypothetical protein
MPANRIEDIAFGALIAWVLCGSAFLCGYILGRQHVVAAWKAYEIGTAEGPTEAGHVDAEAQAR